MKKLFLLFSLLIISVVSFSQDVPQWRGTDRRGIYPDDHLLQKWPDSGLQPIWVKKGIGNGFGTPSIADGKLFVTGEIDSIAWIFCLDKNGNEIWKTAYGKEWIATFPGSRSTPTIVGDLLYVSSGNGNLYCLETSSGKEKWHVDKIKDLHGGDLMHGHSESPLVNDGLVYLVAGGKDTNVVAFDRFNGKIKWICKGKGFSPAYNSPVLITLPERKIMITFTSYAMLGIDANTGELLFTHDQDNVPVDKRGPGMGDTHSNSVWYEDGCIYYFAGDGNGAVKLKLSKDGKNIEQVWRNQSIDNYMGGFIKQGNQIYTCLFEKQRLVTVDAETGSITDSLKIGRGNIIYDGKMLYYYTLRGELNLVKPGPKMELVSKFKITQGTKEHFSHPVICDKILYLRRGNALMAYKIND